MQGGRGRFMDGITAESLGTNRAPKKLRCKKCAAIKKELAELKKIVAKYRNKESKLLKKSKALEEQQKTVNAYLEKAIQQV